MCFIQACNESVIRIMRNAGAYHIKERWYHQHDANVLRDTEMLLLEIILLVFCV